MGYYNDYAVPVADVQVLRLGDGTDDGRGAVEGGRPIDVHEDAGAAAIRDGGWELLQAAPDPWILSLVQWPGGGGRWDEGAIAAMRLGDHGLPLSCLDLFNGRLPVRDHGRIAGLPNRVQPGQRWLYAHVRREFLRRQWHSGCPGAGGCGHWPGPQL